MLAMVIFIFDDVFRGFYKPWLGANFFFDFIYLLDILIQSRTTYIFEGSEVKQTDMTTKNYLHSQRLVLDLLSLFPLDLVLFINPAISIIRMVYEDDSCLYHEENIDRANPYAERLNRSRDYERFWAGKSVVWDMGNFSREYSMSMYWSSLTITTCGQQPYPSSSPQNLLEVVDTLIGVLVFATIIGGVGNVVTQMNQSVYDFRMKMDAIKFYMKYRIVNVDIQERVLQCFMYMNSQSQLTDEAEILEPLPPRLQGQIAVNLHMETLRKVELFRECDVGFLYEIVRKIKQQVYSPNDYLCKAGEKAKEMFIVKKGLLCVVRDEDDFIMETLREGATFGELSVIHIKGNKLGARRTVSLRSVGYSDVYILNQDDVTSILHEYPKDRLILLNTARSMLEARELLDKDVGEMAITGILEDEAMFGILSVEEQLARLKNIIQNVDAQINNIYTSFNDLSSNMKQRVTILEGIYRTNRAEIKKDIMRNMRNVN
ncbi:hypothetical protein WR25_07139 [Diploscapter pachys]|uniref:Cyclic nucleotide-binding domain-containing protein n=1 Tax=Diploscapter pachys TaxID=2018661 RepID=A0A2A2JEX0_9BILA|nr:hypothetical protein WR25_07139 [Diploscapter pachys]